MWFDIATQFRFGVDTWTGFLIVTCPSGTSIASPNATDELSGTDPAWVRLNAAEEYPLEAELASGSAEIFIMHMVVGSIVGRNAIAQEVSKRAGLS